MKKWMANEFGAIDTVLKLQEVDALGNPPTGHLKLKVLCAGVGLPDVLMVKGGYPLVPKPPVSPGQEVVGVVIDTGGCEGFSVGDRIMALSTFAQGAGSFAEYCFAGEHLAAKVPEAMSSEEAAGFLMPFQTAHAALVQRANVRAGETLLVLGGAGGCGSGAIQLGKALGAKVIATAGGKEKVEFCYSLGADHVVDYRQGSLSEQVLAYTPQGVDVIFDAVGGDAYAEAIKCIALHGRVALVGYGSGRWPELDPLDMALRSYTAMGVFLLRSTRREVLQAYEQLFDWYVGGAIKVPIDTVYPFEDVLQALYRVQTDRLGKLIIKVSQDEDR